MQKFNSDEILDFDISEHPDRIFLEEMAALTGRRKVIIIDDDEENEPDDLVRIFRRSNIAAEPDRRSAGVMVSHARASSDDGSSD